MYKTPSCGSGPITSLWSEGRSCAGGRGRAQPVTVARTAVALRQNLERHRRSSQQRLPNLGCPPGHFFMNSITVLSIIGDPHCPDHPHSGRGSFSVKSANWYRVLSVKSPNCWLQSLTEQFCFWVLLNFLLYSSSLINSLWLMWRSHFSPDLEAVIKCTHSSDITHLYGLGFFKLISENPRGNMVRLLSVIDMYFIFCFCSVCRASCIFKTR